MQSSRLALVQTRMRAAEVFDALAATARNYLAPAVRRIEPWLAPLRRRSRRELIFAGSGLFVLIVALIVVHRVESARRRPGRRDGGVLLRPL